MKSERTAGVIAFPPLIYAVPLIGGIVADRLLSNKPLPPASRFLSVGCFLAAGSLVAPAFGAFEKAGTPVDVHEESTALVESGPYQFTRNPIYLGLTLLYAGVALATRRAAPLALLPAVLWTMHHGVILREERYLERKFGTAYRDYAQRVPRWL